MEFEHIGSHCSLPTCKQKDFLPFTCDSCHQQYCLSHRLYEAHGCDGALKKDMTSIDCPVCGKSVKFDKTKDPNEVWEEHYSFTCAKQSNNSSSSSLKCARQGCINHLGPSNTYQCPKCLKKVCLSHRMAEEHDCINAKTKPLSTNRTTNSIPSKIQPSATSRTSVPSSTSQPSSASSNPRDAFLAKIESKSISSGKKPPTQQKITNNLNRGSISVKPPARIEEPSRTESFNCPMCGMDCASLENLSRHVENHLTNETQASNLPQLPQTSSSSNSRIEHCPICSAQFVDPVELVNHVEQLHNQPSPSPQAGNNCTLA